MKQHIKKKSKQKWIWNLHAVHTINKSSLFFSWTVANAVSRSSSPSGEIKQGMTEDSWFTGFPITVTAIPKVLLRVKVL